MNALVIYGNSYFWKDSLKAMGGRWDKNQKVWVMPWTKENEMAIGKMKGLTFAKVNREIADRCKTPDYLYIEAQENAYFDNFAYNLDRN